MTASPLIYLDNHATTRCDPRVVDAMLPYFSEQYGNAGSRSHSLGFQARSAVELARKRVAEWIGARPKEIVFTSGATESNNLAILGTARARAGEGRHVVTVSTEHKAVLDPMTQLEREGFNVTRLGVDGDGLIDLDMLSASLTQDTTLVSVMATNNETGVEQPLTDIAALCRERAVFFHTDAAQATYTEVNVAEQSVDLLSLSGHKIYGPKGIGALYIRRGRPRVSPQPLAHGGGQERGYRPGTLPVPLIVGMGTAAKLLTEEGKGEGERLRGLRDTLLAELSEHNTGLSINGSMQHRAPHNLHLFIEEVDAEALLMATRDVACSTGSACTSATLEPSHVLRAMGLPESRLKSSIRLGLGRFTTSEEISLAIKSLTASIQHLRDLGRVDGL